MDSLADRVQEALDQSKSLTKAQELLTEKLTEKIKEKPYPEEIKKYFEEINKLCSIGEWLLDVDDEISEKIMTLLSHKTVLEEVDSETSAQLRIEISKKTEFKKQLREIIKQALSMSDHR